MGGRGLRSAHRLYYDRFGPQVFKDLARRGLRERLLGEARFEADLRFDPSDCARAGEREGAIWATLVMDERRVGRDAYDAHASTLPSLAPRPTRLAFAAGAPPRRLRGRRPSGAPNATRRASSLR